MFWWWGNKRSVGYPYSGNFFVQDDFLTGTASSGSVGQIGWTFSGTITARASEANHPGVYRVDTGAVQATQGRILPTGTTSIDPAANTNLLWIVRLNTNDTNTTIRIGSANATSADPPNHGIFFEKLDGDTNWFAVCRQASTQTRTNTGIACDTNFHDFEYTRTSAGVVFRIDRVIVATITDNIPSTFISPYVWLINSAAAAKTADVDYFGYNVWGMSR